jgi:hypothetical protein
MKIHPNVTIVTLGALALALASGCASDSEASRQAGQGAKYGAVGGAVAGAVSSLIFGGNVVQGAVAGGITGAASGAAVGGMAGSAADNAKKQNAAKPVAGDPKLAALREKIGDGNYAAAMQLAQCQHRNAIATAQDAFAATQDPQKKTYALAIQAVSAEEAGDKALASSLYPKIAEIDPTRGSPEKMRADALEAVIRVQAARKEHGLPPTCG